MKNNIKIALAVSMILLVLVAGIFVLVSNSNKLDEQEIDSLGDFGKYTYMFSGKSKHYSFDNGFVLYDDNYKKISINSFKQTSKIDNLVSETIKVYFNGNVAYSGENKRGLNKLDKDLNIHFYEAGEDCIDNNCEWDEFVLTNENTFKDSIKIVAEYCTKDKCYDEQFKLEYK